MKQNKNSIIIICLLLAGLKLQAQISTEEKPISFKYSNEMFRTNSAGLRTMPSINLEELRIEDKMEESSAIPPRFGYPHNVNFNLENSGEWFIMPNDDKLWKLEISCPEALSINLLYNKFWLPDGAKFFIYSENKKHSIGAFTSRNNKGTKENLRGFATGLIYNDTFFFKKTYFCKTKIVFNIFYNKSRRYYV